MRAFRQHMSGSQNLGMRHLGLKILKNRLRRASSGRWLHWWRRWKGYKRSLALRVWFGSDGGVFRFEMTLGQKILLRVEFCWLQDLEWQGVAILFDIVG